MAVCLPSVRTCSPASVIRPNTTLDCPRPSECPQGLRKSSRTGDDKPEVIEHARLTLSVSSVVSMGRCNTARSLREEISKAKFVRKR
jgi:hypothetical protein